MSMRGIKSWTSAWRPLSAWACFISLVPTSHCLSLQTPLRAITNSQIFTFDDVKTQNGWGEIPTNYSFLECGGLLVFKPTDIELDGLISQEDLNCATSSPNAIYGTRYNFGIGVHGEPTKLPYIALSAFADASVGKPRSFELQTLKIKPLNMPFGYTTLSLRGHKSSNETLNWEVDFPAGFHEMLKVEIEKFSGKSWSELTKLELWADFHNGEMVLDWEYCLDDLKLKFDFD